MEKFSETFSDFLESFYFFFLPVFVNLCLHGFIENSWNTSSFEICKQFARFEKFDETVIFGIFAVFVALAEF